MISNSKPIFVRYILSISKIKHRKSTYYTLFIVAVAMASCNELLPPEKQRLGYEYFPLSVGDFRIYQTQVIRYLEGTADTTDFQIKEIVSDSVELNGEITYRLDRFRRSDVSQPWVIDSVWSARVNTYQAIVIEHNTPVIKLSFPLAEDRRWDGNAMNTLEFDEFKITDFDLPYEINGNTYPQTLKMFKEDLLDPLKIANDNYHEEVFAKGIGLIRRLDINKKYNSESPGLIEDGIEFGQKLLQIGKL